MHDVSRGMDGSSGRGFDASRGLIEHIYAVLDSNGESMESYIVPARSVIGSLEQTPFMSDPSRTEDQVWLITALQRLAYHEPDSGGVRDIAEWCVTQWLKIVQHHPENLNALQGLGQAWLARAQACLARIHRLEGSSSSGSSGWRGGPGSHVYTSSDEARDAARAAEEADARLHTPDYVEARGILLPSTEYFTRAVNSAELTGQMTGDLLTQAAEAYMSLGNVSYSSVNERYFRQALLYLRRATQISGYTLSPYLQHYLDDYGRLID